MSHNIRNLDIMLASTLSLLAVVSLTAGAPNYGQQVQGTPARQVTVQCRTEYATVWDTRYQEKETQECVTNYREVCTTVSQRQCQPTTRTEVSNLIVDTT